MLFKKFSTYSLYCIILLASESKQMENGIIKLGDRGTEFSRIHQTEVELVLLLISVEILLGIKF